MAFIDLNKCFSDPKYILRLIAVVICISVATYQLSECFTKIMHPPVNTLYGFNLNKTMRFPAITICRDPPYKSDLFKKFNVSIKEKPTTTQFWKYFNFGKYNIEEFMSETTYNLSEFIRYKGFTGTSNIKSDLILSSFTSLTLGKCYTFLPVNETILWSSDSQYSFMVKHNGVTKQAHVISKDPDIEKNFYNAAILKKEDIMGYHVYIHNPSEMVSDRQFQDESFMEYIHVDVGEELKVNLRPHEYRQVPTSDNKCQPGDGYSKSKCQEECLRKHITATLECQSPWLSNPQFPLCSSFNQLKTMLQRYENPDIDCKCLTSCTIIINKPNIQSRRDYTSDPTYSVFYIFYSSNLVTQMSQYIAYDWNIFLADLGGSLGFLLGLSVLGVISVFQSILKFIFKHTCQSKKPEDKKEEKKEMEIDEQGEENKGYFNESKFKEAEASKFGYQNDVSSFNNYYENQVNGHNFLDKY